ncbi:hypothetical protein BS78_07G166700 [Paspalum vaginatum]|nr:hypothetical protein BS78_07G166700 [Paspalum vaginatum]KAJ1268875.1 hypothetical protein BS78_07G166700 [Paspalum vaginatum]KAJ1268879.1 hypothetical protein BS78_07G166700 [Paspalum vaginatum]
MVNETAEKDHGINPENKLRHNFRLGDITWVKCSGSSWWPAQVIDESCVGSKPKKKEKDDCLVRLYGTCQYLYVDPWKSISEFKMMLKQENKNAMEAFREELSCVNSCSDYEEEAVNSEGGASKGTSKKTSSRKGRKQEGLKQQYNEEEDQEIRSTTARVAAKKRKSGRARQSNSTRDAVDKDCNESSDAGLSNNKRQKHVTQRASVGRKEALRRSAHSDATGDSMLDETSAPHTEIKTMVRDILFKDIIDREHDAEMAFVDEVINGICNAAERGVTVGGAASTEGARGVRQTGGGVEGESSNFTQRLRDEAAEDALQLTSPKTMKGNVGTATSREAAVKTPGQPSARQIRQIRIMQSLGLMAPPGSPFGRNAVVAASHQQQF